MLEVYTKNDYSKAYTELLQILKYISQSDYDKIPRELISYFEENKDIEYKYNYNIKVPFEEQKISQLTKAIIANLYVKYWTTDEEKIIIENEEKAYFINLEEKKREKYNPDKIFEKKEEISSNVCEKSLVVVKKKNIIVKIIEMIKEKLT